MAAVYSKLLEMEGAGCFSILERQRGHILTILIKEYLGIAQHADEQGLKFMSCSAMDFFAFRTVFN
jgi:hypothetical protein